MRLIIQKISFTLFIILILGCLSANVYAEQENETTDDKAGIETQEQPVVGEQDENSEEQTDPKSTAISGTVNYDFQLVTAEGKIYDIAESEAGDELVRYTGMKVVARGTVEVVDGLNVLTVKSFDFVE
jgi:hypothetical protein